MVRRRGRDRGAIEPAEAAWLAGGGLVVLLVLAGVYWAFHGLLSGIWRETVASSALTVFALSLAVPAALMLVAFALEAFSTSYTSPEEPWAAAAPVALVVGLVLTVVVWPFGWQARATSTYRSVSVVDTSQAAYDWRLPWTTVSAAAQARAGDVTGEFETGDTTYLPALDVYSTPVRARGFGRGITRVVVQYPDRTTAVSCTTADDVAARDGLFGNNLTRWASFVDAGLSVDPDDGWGFCGDDDARATADPADATHGWMVYPTTRYTGWPEGHRVPGPVLVTDGVELRELTSVARGELPGPVYPASLAADQRTSTHAAAGLVSRITGAVGYETSDDSTDDGSDTAGPDTGNVSELLLARTDDDGYDMVTALTPRGKSGTVVAVATVEADHVTAGELNPLVVHKLSATREGNTSLLNRVMAAFPDLGWKSSGLAMVEVLPTSAGTWTATLANGTTATNRISIDTDGRLCLEDLTGTDLRCVEVDGSTQSSSGQSGTGDVEVDGDLSTLSADELLALDERVDAEMRRRMTATPTTEPGTTTATP